MRQGPTVGAAKVEREPLRMSWGPATAHLPADASRS